MKTYFHAGIAIAITLGCAAAIAIFAYGKDNPPQCKSASSSIRLAPDGRSTIRGPVVWYPEGCKHD